MGDSVCIGRDKRQCKIVLGVNAQGVSRVHLKLELLSNGRVSFCYKDPGEFRVSVNLSLNYIRDLTVIAFLIYIDNS